MGLFNLNLTEDKTIEGVKTSYEKVEKAASKLLGDAITDYNLVGCIASADDESTRTATNYINLIASAKEFGDKQIDFNIKMYENIAKMIESEEKRGKEIENLHKENEELKRLLYKITDKLDKLDKLEK